MKKVPVKLMHLRALPVCVGCLVAGILFVSIDVWWLSLLCYLVSAIALVVATVKAPKRKALGIACLVCLALSLVTVARVNSVTNVTPIEAEMTVEGRICEVQTDGDGRVTGLVLDDLTWEGAAHKGKMQTTVPAGQWLHAPDQQGYVVGVLLTVGDSVSVTGKVTDTRFDFYDSYSVHCALQHLVYHQQTTALTRLDTPTQRRPIERVQQGLYRVLRRNMRAHSAGFAFAFLTGNTCYVSPYLLSGFRLTGTAHLLAVSGLHVGLLAGVLVWLLKKCRCPAWARVIVLVALLGVYAILCGGTPSVLRAAVLAVAMAAAQACGLHRDSPSLLALAAGVLLVVQPLYLFDVGFLLSFGAFGGIVLLYRPLHRLTEHLPAGENAVALNLSVGINIWPVTAYFFGGVSWLSLPINLLIIPVMSVVYVVLFGATLLAVIPPLGFVLGWLDRLLDGVFEAVTTLSAVGWATTQTRVWMLPLFYGGTALASDYCLLPKPFKYASAATLCLTVGAVSFAL